MPEKSPETWSWLSAAIGLAAALCGGAVEYRAQLKYQVAFRVGAFLFDMFTSAFVGLMAWWVCHDVLQQPDALCACAAGFAGNLGASVFDIGKDVLERRIGAKRAGADKGEKDGE